MEHSKAMETIAKHPVLVTHESIMLYSSLKQCMANNEELRQTLIDAALIIQQLTQKLQEKNEDNSVTP
jgi:hypothetical protein